MDNMLMTSGYNFEGYRIKKYLGFCSGECALGTGFFSSLGAGIADVLGSNSTMYEEKLSRAKDMAVKELINAAKRLGADAVIGMDVDYTTFTSDIMGVIASGTAVTVEKPGDKTGTMNRNTSENVMELPVINYYTQMPIRPYSVIYDIENECVQLVMQHFITNNIWAMNIDIIFNTIFSTTYVHQDINFTNIETELLKGRTENVKLAIPENQIKVINSAIVKINHLVYGESCISPTEEYKISPMTVQKLKECRHEYGNDIVCNFSKNEGSWTCICGRVNSSVGEPCNLCGRTEGVYEKASLAGASDLSDLLPVLDTLPRAKDILDYLTEMKAISNAQLLEELNDLVKSERFYGSMKVSCMKKLKDYLEEAKS